MAGKSKLSDFSAEKVARLEAMLRQGWYERPRVSQIAAHFGIGRRAVEDFAKKKGIDLRPPGVIAKEAGRQFDPSGKAPPPDFSKWRSKASPKVRSKRVAEAAERRRKLAESAGDSATEDASESLDRGEVGLEEGVSSGEDDSTWDDTLLP